MELGIQKDMDLYDDSFKVRLARVPVIGALLNAVAGGTVSSTKKNDEITTDQTMSVTSPEETRYRTGSGIQTQNMLAQIEKNSLD